MEEIILPGYTRVTEILRPWNDFSKIPPEVLEHKRQIGERVHEAIRCDLENLLPEIDDEIRGYFDSYYKWKNLSGQRWNPILVESRMYDDYLMITGKIDVLYQVPYEGGLVLVDWKTSASCDKKTARSWQLQGTLYHYLLSKTRDDLADRFLFLQLDPDGKWPHVKEFKFDPKIMALCSSAVELYRYFNS